MAASFSFAQIGGTLGRDPEVKSTSTGKKVVNFSLAVNRGWGDKQQTLWFNIVAWGQQAEFAEKYLKKGKSVAVSGELLTRSWEDNAGQKRTVTEINALSISFLDSRNDKQEERPAPKPQPKAQPRLADDWTDDTPF